ncbi:hypothetical protein JTB14_005167 [Gonioctena quinquepunctata]|nr:hypothetical protein JTB14_005167 [Gonioctena quinquepunctata]
MHGMRRAHRNAIQTIEATTDRVHGQFNTKAKEPGFAIGDQVYLYQPAKQAGSTSKWAKKWMRPYRINAKIKKIHGKKEQLVHVNRLKQCLATEDLKNQLGNVVTGLRTHNREPPRRGKVQTISGAGLQVARENMEAGG